MLSRGLFLGVLLGMVACSSDDAAAPGGTGTGTGPATAKPDGSSCTVPTDCTNGVCTAGTCTTASPTDKVKNGDETDVDCGGAKASKCAAGLGCAKNEDCATDACGYAKKCVESPSCTIHLGGDTCGPGEVGAADAKHESCCTTVMGAKGTKLGKYAVTAGRMRAFVDRYKGNLKEWVTTAKPKDWQASWTDNLPASADDALVALGPDGKKGCDVASNGGRTYWQPPIGGDKDEVSDWSQDVLDTKAQNCVTWHMAQAFCMFDGGRLAMHAEVMGEVTNGGATKFPWGNTPVFKKDAQFEQIVHFYSYQSPDPPAGLRTQKNGQDPVDQSLFMAPPGRRPTGASKAGVADAMGNMMPWVGDGPNEFAWTASWEAHEMRPDVGTWPGKDDAATPDGYYAIGIRCAYPQ